MLQTHGNEGVLTVQASPDNLTSGGAAPTAGLYYEDPKWQSANFCSTRVRILNEESLKYIVSEVFLALQPC